MTCFCTGECRELGYCPNINPKPTDALVDLMSSPNKYDKNQDEATRDEPEPNGEGVDVAKAVQRDIEARAELGKEKYGERLTSENGRDPLVDAYQEQLDGLMYMKQALIERYD